MKKIAPGTSCAALLLALSACADDGAGDKSYGDPKPASQAESTSAQSAVTGVSDMRSLSENDPKDTTAVARVSGVYGNVNVLTASKQASQLQGGLAAATGGLLGVMEGALDESCVQSGGGTVTYDNCDFGTAKMNGTIGFQDPTLTVDLTITVGVSGVASNIDYEGTLEVSATAIVGTLSFKAASDVSGAAAGAAGGGSFQTTTTVDATYDVELTDGCPTGGEVEIHSVSGVSGSGLPSGAGGQDVWVKALFGPNCGDVQVQ
ncbi:MAG: hypothetical protein AMXMBFR64_55170 [Myxococcales bacterium]